MKLLFVLLVSIPLVACSQKKDLKKESEKVFEQIRNYEFAKVTVRFDSLLSRRIDTLRLRKNWESIVGLAGNFRNTFNVTQEKVGNTEVVMQFCQFEKRKMNLKLVYDSTGSKIRQLSFLGGEKVELYKLPSYYDSTLISEKELAIQNTIYKLPGILTTPNTPGRHPVVILVHGAGANDKDETVGPMKIFKDLAIGLAQKGVAVYRYEKRTRVYRGRMIRNIHFTVNEETIDDAAAAVRLMKTDSLIDSTRIYVLGHSLGGMLLPRIAAKAPDIKGLIYLAANARPIEDLIYEQAKFMASIDTTGKDSRPLLDSIKRETEKIKALKETDSDSLSIFQISASYWRDLNNYDPLKSAAEINKPMLFLHGGRDYQVTETDFNLYKERLKGKPAEFKLYPDLNHFFITGNGRSVPSEYQKNGNVDIRVINDISSWILPPKK